MHEAAYDEASAIRLAALGYDESEVKYILQAVALMGPPLEPFARDLKTASVHVTGHQLMAVWQGCDMVKAHLSLDWPKPATDHLISGNVDFDGLPERMSTRQVVAVAGVVAELLIEEHGNKAEGDDWELFDRLRDGAWMSPEDHALTGGKITWHAVRRASKLLRRHWNIVSLSSASKRKDLLFRLLYNLPGSKPPCFNGERGPAAPLGGFRGFKLHSGS